MNIGKRLFLYPIARLWILFILIALFPLRGIPQLHKPASAALFYQLRHMPVNQRVANAEAIYKNNLRRVAYPVVMHTLDTLKIIARELNDLPLECAVLSFRADYLSVNYGFNSRATDYYQQAIDFAEDHDMPVETAVYLEKKGLYFRTFSHNTEACQYFLEAYEKFKEVGFNRIPQIATYLLEQGIFYYHLKDYDTSLKLLTTSLNYPDPDARTSANITNTIGLIYRNKMQFQYALSYFNRALQAATQHKDSAWIAIIKGNIGSVYFMQGKYKEALPLVAADYRTSMHFRDSVNAAIALLRLSDINLNSNNLSAAAGQLDTAATLIANKTNVVNLSSLVSLNLQRSILYQHTGNLALAIEYRKKYELAKDSLARRDNMAAIENVKLKWEIINHRTQINQLNNIIKLVKFKRNAIICILMLVGIIIMLLFNRQRLKNQRQQQQLRTEKQRVANELDNAARSLQQYTEHLRQNTLIIERFKSELAQLKAQSAEGRAQLDRQMQAHIMTNESWDEFKKLFEKVHAGFFTRLRQTYPKLTDTDMRLLSLVKLKLNNREMAGMLGVTVEGVKKSKQRMRKKMELQPDVDIEQTIANF